MAWLYFLILLLLSVRLVGTVLNYVFENSSIAIRDKRIKQLKIGSFKNKKTPKEIIDEVTSPIITYLFPKLKGILPTLNIKKISELEKKLKVVHWNQHFSAETFIAVSLLTKVAAIIVFVLLKDGDMGNTSNLFLLVICIVLFTLLDKLLKIEIKDVQKNLLYEFPNLIRVMGSYLAANLTLVDSAKHSLKYAGKAWHPILINFINDIENQDTLIALENMKKAAPIFEAREFISLLRLNLEQGGDIRESFEEEAEKIQGIKKAAALQEIDKRKIYGICIQMPLVLVMMLVILIPMLLSIDFSGFGI